MATISNAVIQANPTTPAVGAPIRITVTFNVTFTPMERLLASNGLSFRDNIRLFESDLGLAGTDNDDFLPPAVNNIIAAANIAAASNNVLNISRSFTRTVQQLRGPNDELPFPNPNLRQIEARIQIAPIPNDPTLVGGNSAITSTVSVNVSELGDIEQ